MSGPSVERSMNDPNLVLRCQCGWDGRDDEIREWDVQVDRDRVVRNCPSCEEPVPEWGAFTPIDGVASIAHGPLKAAFAEAKDSK